jgi:hypothetical protein
VGGFLAAQSPAPTNRLPGKIVVGAVTGEAFAMGTDDPQRIPLKKESVVFEGQVITTAKDSSVILVFSNGATLNLGAESVLSIDEFLQDPFAAPVKVGELMEEPTVSTTKLNLLRGELISNVKKLHKDAGSSFTVQTPVGAAGIRGTTFRLTFKPQGSRASFSLTMLEGVIELVFGNRPSVTVSDNKELVLNDIEIDPATGKVLRLPAIGQPTDVSAATRAALMAKVQELFSIANTISFAPSLAGLSGTQQAVAQPSGGSTQTSETTSSGQTPSALPAPPAAQPPARVTPGDGKS